MNSNSWNLRFYLKTEGFYKEIQLIVIDSETLTWYILRIWKLSDKYWGSTAF